MNNKQYNVIAGIDYSLTGPAICVHNGVWEFNFDNCEFFFLCGTKKYTGKWLHNINGESFTEWNESCERYESIADWAIDICLGCTEVVLEDYAYGAKGKVFHIAENTGVLKYKLYQMSIPTGVVSPTHVKKLATGKGNANKQAMHDAFFAETGMNLKGLMTPDKKEISSPVTDIVDSYYICKYLYQTLNQTQP